ncbi:MAG: hypothetical protein EBU90_31750 [Proteobacteria bacterium]|nr:hypothetical protein [Pseudomonadota bacterium]
MAVRNPVTGVYEAKKVFKSTGEVVVGYGDSKEAAKANLKERLKEYENPLAGFQGQPKYKPKLVESGDYVNSPGFTASRGADGRIVYAFDPNKKTAVKTRPDLARKVEKGESKQEQSLVQEEVTTEGQ